MKILYVITGLALGGAERIVVDLADQMSYRGHQVKIAYLVNDIKTRPQNQNIELIYIGLENLFVFPLAYIRLRKLIIKYAPNIIHTHMIHANIFTRLIRTTTPVAKLICTAHSSNEGGRLRMLAYRLTHSLADITTNVSLEATQALIQKNAAPKGGIIPLYNGINIKKFHFDPSIRKRQREILNLEHHTLMLLAVGRLTHAKDYPNLLHAISLLSQKSMRSFKLFIAGDGELRAAIEQLIQKLELTQYVELLGVRTDIPALMNAADIFILSSQHEGFGLVVAEAMACNCFVVATDCGGVAEVMGNTGSLVPPKNSQKLANALYEAMTLDKESIEKNNHQALTHIKENFDLENIVEKWIKLYENKQ